MHRVFLSRLGAGGLPLALAAGLALTASACMAPSAKKSAAAGASERAAGAASGQQSGAEGEKAKGERPSWWQRITRHPEDKPWVYGDIRPGKGVASSDEHGFVLLRKGEGQSSDPAKPSKVRR